MILFFSHNLNYEGAPKLLFTIVKGVCKKFPSAVLSPFSGDLQKYYEEIGVPVFLFPTGNNCHPADQKFPEFISSLEKIIRENKIRPDLFVYNTADMVGIVELGKRFRKPTIGIIHESADPYFYFFRFEGNPLPYLDLLGSSDCVVFVSEETRQVYQPFISQSRVRVIPNGIDPKELSLGGPSRVEIRQELGLKNNEILIVQLGTVCHRKGAIYLARAALEMWKQFPGLKMKLFFVGDRRENPDEMFCSDAIRNIARKAGREEQIRLIKITDDVTPYLKAADIFALASLNESFPLATLEAMAFGLPVVASSIFGLKEQIHDGQNGILVPPANSHKLAQGLLRLVRNPRLRKRLGQAGLWTVQNRYHRKGMISKYSRLFSAYVNQARKNVR